MLEKISREQNAEQKLLNEPSSYLELKDALSGLTAALMRADLRSEWMEKVEKPAAMTRRALAGLLDTSIINGGSGEASCGSTTSKPASFIQTLGLDGRGTLLKSRWVPTVSLRGLIPSSSDFMGLY